MFKEFINKIQNNIRQALDTLFAELAVVVYVISEKRVLIHVQVDDPRYVPLRTYHVGYDNNKWLNAYHLELSHLKPF
jgi:hypothetical protein